MAIGRHDRQREVEFERAAMPHAASLLRAALRLTGEPAQAEDLVQEALLRAWRSFDQFQAGTNCKAWLFRIMLNLSSKRQKQRRGGLQMVSLEEHEERLASAGAAQASRFSQGEIFAALDSMPEEQRSVLILAVVEGFTCKEIAPLVGAPLGTVMSRLSRARVSLRQRLGEVEKKKLLTQEPEKLRASRAGRGVYELR